MQELLIEEPAVIQAKIDELQKQLKISKEYYEYRLLVDDRWGDDMIGLFNMGKARIILNELVNGKILQLRHGVYGKYIVQLNPQKNSLFVKCCNNKPFDDYSTKDDPITYDNILNFVLWGAGDWYVKNEEITKEDIPYGM